MRFEKPKDNRVDNKHWCGLCKCHTDHRTNEHDEDYESGGFQATKKPSGKVTQASKDKSHNIRHGA